MKLSIAGVLLCIAAAPAQPAALDDLGWLAGCWAAERGDAGSGENWMTPAGGSVFGMARTVRGGRTVAHEFLHISDSADGLVLVAMPSSKPSARFKAIRVGARHVTFENPDKDFPQRVIYESPDDATLVGRIEGVHEGRERRIDFPLKRVACPGGAR